MLAGAPAALADTAERARPPALGTTPIERTPAHTGDFSSPPRLPDPTDTTPTRPSGFDPATSVLLEDQTTETRRVYRNGDHTETAVVNSMPARFRDPVSGAWREIDVTPERRADGAFAARSARDSATISASSVGVVVTQPTSAGPVLVRHPDATGAAATTTPTARATSTPTGRVTYPSGLSGGRDLAVALTASGFEQDVVLRSRDSASDYRVEFVLPAGMAARPAASGVEFVDRRGNAVAGFGGGFAYDSSPAPRGAMAPVSTRLVSQVGNVATVEVSVNPGWVADPARVFPATIDPLFYQNTSANGSGAWDTYVENLEYANTSFKTQTNMFVGSGDSGAHVTRSQLKFNIDQALVDSRPWVLESHLAVNNSFVWACAPRAVKLSGLASAPQPTTPTWNNSPGIDATTTVTSAPFAYGATGCPGNWQNFDTTALARKWLYEGAANNGIQLSAADEADNYAFKAFLTGETGSNTAPALYITYNHKPSAAVAVAPADNARLTPMPTLSVGRATDPNGDAVEYWFKILDDDGTESDAAHSGWLPTPPSGDVIWQIPEGLLSSGRYKWQVWTRDKDGSGLSVDPGWWRHFSLDWRLGDQPGQPYDDFGPFRVNLTTGNLTTELTTPAASAVGGPLGLSMTYNSQVGSKAGLSAAYYADLDQDRNFDTNEGPFVTRLDRQMHQDWINGSPAEGVIPTDYFLGRWEGFFTPPTTAPPGSSSYTFGAAFDDGVRIWVNNVLVLDRWTGPASASTVFGTPITLNAATPVPIRIEFNERTGTAMMKASVTWAGLNGEKALSADMLSPMVPMLPGGWGLIEASPGGLAYVNLRVRGNVVTAVEPDGASHDYLWSAARSAYDTPPEEEGSFLFRTAGGRFSLRAFDGQTYEFDEFGTLRSLRTGTDDLAPAAVAYTWLNDATSPSQTPNLRLADLTDPVSGRKLHLQYWGNANPDSAAGSCPSVPSGQNLDATQPVGLLCQVTYSFTNPSNGARAKSQYFYATPTGTGPAPHAQLARVVHPGGATTDLHYDGKGRIDRVRDPAAYDAVAAGVRTDATEWIVTYETNGSRVTTITGPRPTAAATPAASVHRYAYGSGIGAQPASPTVVNVDGLTPVGGATAARRVTFDDRGHTLTDTDANNATSSATWDAVVPGMQLSSKDPAGRISHTIYDGSLRPVDVYGPAPETGTGGVACFDAVTRTPKSPVPAGCLTAVPRTTTGYDEGIGGLAGEYFDDITLAGPVARHVTTGGGDPATADGVLIANSTTPLAGLADNNFGASFSGHIDLPVAGTWRFSSRVAEDTPGSPNDTVMAWVDGELMVNGSYAHAGFTDPAAESLLTLAAGRHDVEVLYNNNGGAARAELWWYHPSNPSTRVLVPAGALSPGYGLPTSTTTHDATSGSPPVRTATRYGATPETGQPTATVNDPGPDPAAADLVTSATYEPFQTAPVPLFRRRTSRTLPAGGTTTYDNYDFGEGAAANDCGVSTGVNQAGLLKSATSPTAAGGTTRVETYVYDDAGRIRGRRVSGGGWSCTTYDDRGRTTEQKVFPPSGSTPERTMTFSYNAVAPSGGAASPLVSVSTETGTSITLPRTIASATDLLGRTVEYQDATTLASPGYVTFTTYDQAGRAVSATTTKAGIGQLTRETTYEAGRVDTQRVDGSQAADATYNGAGELTGVAYGNGSSLAVERDAVGRTTRLRSTNATGTIADDVVMRSQSGRVVDQTIDGVDANPAGSNYLYDRAGRLVDAYVPGHRYQYSFTATPTCGTGSAAAAGKNTNRRSMIHTDLASSVSTTTEYCYDAADRLLTSTDGAVATAGYDQRWNTTALGTETLTYDATDRHTSTTAAGTTVTYERDATDRVISRTIGLLTITYGFGGPGDSPSFATQTGVTDRMIPLVGGVLLNKRLPGDVWSYPNIHGDVVATANASGAKTAGPFHYEPFGEVVGTGRAENAPDNLDYGWHGSAQRGVEHEAGIDITQMGARPYVSKLGRFLRTDPVRGGSSNDYEYGAGDPVNFQDLDGRRLERTHIDLYLSDPMGDPDYSSSSILHMHVTTTVSVRVRGDIRLQRKIRGKWTLIGRPIRFDETIMRGQYGDSDEVIQYPAIRTRYRVHVNIYVTNLEDGGTVHFIQNGYVVCNADRCRRDGGDF